MTSSTENLWGASDYAPTAHRLAPVAPVLVSLTSQTTPSPATVLEIGAGHGHLAALLADHGYDVIALEPTHRMREIGSLQTPDSVRWIDATAEMTGLDDESVDLVVSSFGLMFADPIAGTAEMARALRPGGSLIMTAWAPDGFLHDMATRMITVLPHVANAPHLAWSRRGFAENLLGESFEKITITERQPHPRRHLRDGR